MSARNVAIGLSLALSACSSTGSYDESWGDGVFHGGKNDGLADEAVELTFGEAATGAVDEQSLKLYKISLDANDKIKIVKTVTDGDLSPHFTLHRGLFSTQHSDSYDVQADRLEKNYSIEATQTHLIVARAYQGEGAGEFSITVSCTGGPCAGEFVVEPLDAGDTDKCLNDALECAFVDMQVFDGAVGPARSRSIFEGCLSRLGTSEGVSCSSACSEDGYDDSYLDPGFVCEEIISDLPFFADQSQECLDVALSCFDWCDSYGGDADFGVCYSFGFNGTCPSYAKELTTCGGAVAPDSNEACHLECEATLGAFNDDLDVMCEEECD